VQVGPLVVAAVFPQHGTEAVLEPVLPPFAQVAPLQVEPQAAVFPQHGTEAVESVLLPFAQVAPASAELSAAVAAVLQRGFEVALVEFVLSHEDSHWAVPYFVAACSVAFHAQQVDSAAAECAVPVLLVAGAAPERGDS
jgi:hypothetical protein